MAGRLARLLVEIGGNRSCKSCLTYSTHKTYRNLGKETLCE
jgi:hypothetical protein